MRVVAVEPQYEKQKLIKTIGGLKDMCEYMHDVILADALAQIQAGETPDLYPSLDELKVWIHKVESIT